MDGRLTARGVLDAEVIVGKVAFDIPGPLAIGPAILERGLQMVIAATVERGGASIDLRAILGCDVNDAGGLEPELRRERPINQAHALDKPAVEFHAEPGDPLGKQDAVNPELEVVMLAADVELAERILGDTRGAQDGLVYGGVVALGLDLDLAGGDGVGGGAEAWDDGIAGFVEFLDDIDLRHQLGGAGNLGGEGVLGAGCAGMEGEESGGGEEGVEK